MDKPVILFGAFDRHNLGDLLFPHVAAALLGDRELVFAGVVQRDLRRFGGHAVVSLSTWQGENGGPSHLVHVGGEVLTCDAWQAAVMVSSPEEARGVIAAYDADKEARAAWARKQLGIARRVPYVAANGRGALVFCGVGGVELAGLPPVFRDEVSGVLRQADYLGVRDRVTQEILASAGIGARLVPDPAVMVAEFFGDLIRRRLESGEPARVRDAFPQGYLAVQFSADFGDDATLAQIAAQLDLATAETGLGIVFFRAGAAPWHDDLEVLRATAGLMASSEVRVFESLDVWDICALLAGSRGYCGSSLHGRIVATAFALPRLNFLHPAQGSVQTKQEAYAQTWEPDGLPGVVAVTGIADALRLSLAADRDILRRAADSLCSAYRAGFSQWRQLLD